LLNPPVALSFNDIVGFFTAEHWQARHCGNTSRAEESVPVRKKIRPPNYIAIRRTTGDHSKAPPRNRLDGIGLCLHHEAFRRDTRLV
jgi:hypothetical protein